MKIVLDFQTIYDHLAKLTGIIDFYALFFIVFIALACFSAVSLALKLLADKKIKFSFSMLFLFLVVSGTLFCLAYIEHVERAKVFENVYRVVLYSAGEFMAITVLYAVFFGFAYKDDKACRLKKETAVCLAKVVKNVSGDDKRVYKIATDKYDFHEKKEEDIYVDFGGVYKFINALKENGEDDEKLRALERKISFYDGLPINKGTLPMVNNLFSKVVRLAREK